MLTQNWLSTRGQQRVLRRLDALCVLLLVFSLSYIILHGLAGSNTTLSPNTENRDYMTSDKRKCPVLVFERVPGHFSQDGVNNLEKEQRRKRTIIEQVRRDASLEEPVFHDVKVKEGNVNIGEDNYITHDGGAGGDSDKVMKSQYGKKKLCPEFPTNMKGENVCVCDPVTPELLKSLWPNLERGGRLRPSTCRARERVAIIIPFRNRTSHLHKLIHHLLPMLERQNADVTFFIIEQFAPSMFNRATLHNIGFLEAQKVDSFDCYIFHDVDLVPMDDRILYRCADNPRHFAVSIKHYGRRQARKMYNDYFGGIVALTRRQYIDVNGNSNLYFGWGGEDDDLLRRVLSKGYKRTRENPQIFRFEMMQHERNDHSRGNIDRMLLLQTSVDRQDFEGLSTTKYQVKEIRFDHLYVWISVTFNMTELLLTAPDYALSSIKSLLEISKTVT